MPRLSESPAAKENVRRSETNRGKFPSCSDAAHVGGDGNCSYSYIEIVLLADSLTVYQTHKSGHPAVSRSRLPICLWAYANNLYCHTVMALFPQEKNRSTKLYLNQMSDQF